MFTQEEADRYLADVEAAFDAGTITEDRATALLQASRATGTLIPVETGMPKRENDPRKAPPVTLSDSELYVSAMRYNDGTSEVDALRAALHMTPGTDVQAIVEKERERLQAVADRKARAQYDATPEGRRERGEQLAAERAELRKLDAPARELLLETGLDQQTIDSMAMEDRLEAAGLWQRPAPQRESRSRFINKDVDETARQAGREFAAMAQKGGESSGTPH
jgi:hypothetical protein